MPRLCVAHAMLWAYCSGFAVNYQQMIRKSQWACRSMPGRRRTRDQSRHGGYGILALSARRSEDRLAPVLRVLLCLIYCLVRIRGRNCGNRPWSWRTGHGHAGSLIFVWGRFSAVAPAVMLCCRYGPRKNLASHEFDQLAGVLACLEARLGANRGRFVPPSFG